eukprot:414857_1
MDVNSPRQPGTMIDILQQKKAELIKQRDEARQNIRTKYRNHIDALLAQKRTVLEKVTNAYDTRLAEYESIIVMQKQITQLMLKQRQIVYRNVPNNRPSHHNNVSIDQESICPSSTATIDDKVHDEDTGNLILAQPQGIQDDCSIISDEPLTPQSIFDNGFDTSNSALKIHTIGSSSTQRDGVHVDKSDARDESTEGESNQPMHEQGKSKRKRLKLRLGKKPPTNSKLDEQQKRSHSGERPYKCNYVDCS